MHDWIGNGRTNLVLSARGGGYNEAGKKLTGWLVVLSIKWLRDSQKDV